MEEIPSQRQLSSNDWWMQVAKGLVPRVSCESINIALELLIWFSEIWLQLHHGSTFPLAKPNFPHLLSGFITWEKPSFPNQPLANLGLQYPTKFAFFLPISFLLLLSHFLCTNPLVSWPFLAHTHSSTYPSLNIHCHFQLYQEYFTDTPLGLHSLQLYMFKHYPFLTIWF